MTNFSSEWPKCFQIVLCNKILIILKILIHDYIFTMQSVYIYIYIYTLIAL